MAGSVSVRNKVSSVSKNANKTRTSERKARLSKSSVSMKKEANYNRRKSSASATNNKENARENAKSISDEISRSSSNNKSGKALSKSKKNNNDENAVALPDGCECGPDLYTPVLGPTVDETILNGLNTILQLYNKLRDCGQDKEEDKAIDDGMGDEDEDANEGDDNLSQESLQKEEDESITGESAEVGIQEDLTPAKPPKDKRSSQTLSADSQSGRTQTKKFSTASFGVQVFPSMHSKVVDVRPTMASESLQVSLPNLPSQEPMPEKSSVHQVLQTSGPVVRPAQTSTPRSSVMSLPMQTSRPSVNDGGFQTPTPSMTDHGNVPDTRVSLPKSHQTPPRDLSQGSIQTEASAMSMSENPSQTETRRVSQGRVQTDPKPRREPSTFSNQQSQSWYRPPPIVEEESAPPPQVTRTVEASRIPKRAPTASTGSYSSGGPSIYSQQSQTLAQEQQRSQSQTRRPSVSRHTSDHPIMRDSDSGDNDKGADQASETGKRDQRDSSSQNQSQGQSRQSGGDEHSCISPPEPPRSCPCCRCTSSSSSRNILKKRSISSGHHKPECVCRGSKTKLKCRCSSSLKKGDSSCSKFCKGDAKEQPIDVKYAITKISKFADFTTYEVMRATHSVPKKMPKGVDGVFVLKKKNSGR